MSPITMLDLLTELYLEYIQTAAERASGLHKGIFQQNCSKLPSGNQRQTGTQSVSDKCKAQAINKHKVNEIATKLVHLSKC